MHEKNGHGLLMSLCMLRMLHNETYFCLNRGSELEIVKTLLQKILSAVNDAVSLSAARARFLTPATPWIRMVYPHESQDQNCPIVEMAGRRG
jgi:hypothetical protein